MQEEAALVYSILSARFDTAKFVVELLGTKMEAQMLFFLWPVTAQQANSPDDIYVDGVSLTHEMPRKHIWTFAVGGTDGSFGDNSINCPCFNPAASSNRLPPTFVGNDYFCESGNHGQQLSGREMFFEDDPLWDGQQCECECCSSTGNSAPWFHVSLPEPTTDNIEIRICANEGTQNEDSPLQMFEIYIQ